MTSRSAGNTPADMGDSELIREILNQIVDDVESRLHEVELRSDVSPLERLKTISKLIGNKASIIPSECSSLDVCTRYDHSKREAQLEDYREAVRDVICLSLEAELNANRLEARFRGDRA